MNDEKENKKTVAVWRVCSQLHPPSPVLSDQIRSDRFCLSLSSRGVLGHGHADAHTHVDVDA